MPFPNQHSARIIDPGKFEKNSFRSKNIAPGIRIITGKLKGRSSMTVQTYRFDSSKFTAKEAHEWLKKHNVDNIDFEEAENKMTKATDIKEKVLEYLKKNPAPEDETQFHKFAEKVAKEHDIAEEAAYSIIGSLMTGGKSKGKKNNVDPKELAMGIKIESEHTDNKTIAEKIARDHLAEFSNYYSELKKMETKMEDKKPMKKAFIKIFDNVYVRVENMEKARPTKYIKRIPKPTGKGYYYFYNQKQIKDYKEKGIAPEEKKGSVFSSIMNFFGFKDEKQAENKVNSLYNENKGQLKGVDKDTFTDYMNEYLSNKDKWDKKFAPKSTKKKDLSEKKSSVSGDKKTVMSDKGGQKWNTSLMKTIAGIVSGAQEQADINVGDKEPVISIDNLSEKQLSSILNKMGAKIWEKNGMKRAYFNNLADLADFNINRYNTGNISSASWGEDSISNSQARKILPDSFSKFWYDLNDKKFHSKDLHSDVFQYLEEKMNKQFNNEVKNLGGGSKDNFEAMPEGEIERTEKHPDVPTYSKPPEGFKKIEGTTAPIGYEFYSNGSPLSKDYKKVLVKNAPKQEDKTAVMSFEAYDSFKKDYSNNSTEELKGMLDESSYKTIPKKFEERKRAINDILKEREEKINEKESGIKSKIDTFKPDFIELKKIDSEKRKIDEKANEEIRKLFPKTDMKDFIGRSVSHDDQIEETVKMFNYLKDKPNFGFPDKESLKKDIDSIEKRKKVSSSNKEKLKKMKNLYDNYESEINKRKEIIDNIKKKEEIEKQSEKEKDKHTKREKEIQDKITKDYQKASDDEKATIRKLKDDVMFGRLEKARQASELLISELAKAKKAPIGTVSGKYKKVAEGKWVPVDSGKEGKTGKDEKKTEKPKPEAQKDPKKEAQREKIKSALKKIATIFSDALSMRDTVQPTGQAVEETGESISRNKKQQKPEEKKPEPKKKPEEKKKENK